MTFQIPIKDATGANLTVPYGDRDVLRWGYNNVSPVRICEPAVHSGRAFGSYTVAVMREFRMARAETCHPQPSTLRDRRTWTMKHDLLIRT